MILGRGAYGSVTSRDGKAIKKYTRLSALIQEYIALKYLSDCKHIVHTKGANFSKLELYMDLYDSNLRRWLQRFEDNKEERNININIILTDILMGLVELHDRSLAHGDLKPDNILIKNKPFGAVLGDCGFVSIYKYAKVNRTAPIYRDPIISHDLSHDMFSFGIILLEIVADIKIHKQPTYEELRRIITTKVHDKEYKNILYSLLGEDRNKRPSSREVLYKLYNKDPPHWRQNSVSISNSNTFNISKEIKFKYRHIMKNIAIDNNINRAKKGYYAFLSYVQNNNIGIDMYLLHIGVTIMILSSIFGRGEYKCKNVYNLCNGKYPYNIIYNVLGNMILDDEYINIILSP